MKINLKVQRTYVRVIISLLLALGWNAQVFALQFVALETFENNLYRVDTDNLGSPEFLGVIGAGSGPDLSELVNAGPNRLYTLDRLANALWTISIDDPANPVVVGLDRDVTPHPRGSKP